MIMPTILTIYDWFSILAKICLSSISRAFVYLLPILQLLFYFAFVSKTDKQSNRHIYFTWLLESIYLYISLPIERTSFHSFTSRLSSVLFDISGFFLNTHRLA